MVNSSRMLPSKRLAKCDDYGTEGEGTNKPVGERTPLLSAPTLPESDAQPEDQDDGGDNA